MYNDRGRVSGRTPSDHSGVNPHQYRAISVEPLGCFLRHFEAEPMGVRVLCSPSFILKIRSTFASRKRASSPSYPGMRWIIQQVTYHNLTTRNVMRVVHCGIMLGSSSQQKPVLRHSSWSLALLFADPCEHAQKLCFQPHALIHS